MVAERAGVPGLAAPAVVEHARPAPGSAARRFREGRESGRTLSRKQALSIYDIRVGSTK